MNSRAELYGAGVFTTVRIINGKPWLWDKHVGRLKHAAAKLGIDLTFIPDDHIFGRLETRILGQDISAGRARITILDKRDSALWPGTARNAGASLTIQTAPLNEVPRPLRLGVSPHLVNSTSPLAGLKTCNYLDQTLAVENAKGQGFNESVRVNESGHVTSACMANILWLKNDRLFTPSLSTGCLAGTTREIVIESFSVEEVEVEIYELKDADSIFLTSAGLGVVEVDEFDGRQKQPSGHAILNIVPGTQT